jgi:hypothetical protein
MVPVHPRAGPGVGIPATGDVIILHFLCPKKADQVRTGRFRSDRAYALSGNNEPIVRVGGAKKAGREQDYAPDY